MNTIRGILAFGLVSFLFVDGAPADTEPDPFETADARIERHRKSDVEIRVVDADGKPIPGAKVDVKQTNSAFLFGSNIFMWGRFGDSDLDAAYKQRFAEVFNFATLPYYWWSYERKQGEPAHDHRMQVAKWCLENGIKPKGHPLAWNYVDPGWLPDDSEEILGLQLARIGDCVSHFKGTIDTWDVVNEMAHYDREKLKDKQAPRPPG